MFEAEVIITLKGETLEEVKTKAYSCLSSGVILTVSELDIETKFTEDGEYVDSDEYYVENGIPYCK